MAEEVVLHNFYRSSASWRVRIALAIKNVKYAYVPVELVESKMQHSEEYKKLNPMAQVPTLHIDGHYLTQSLPIIEYLEEKYPEPTLLPRDAYGRAQVRAMAEIINSGIQPFQNNTTLNMIGDGCNDWAKRHIEYGFRALESILTKTAGKYSYGDDVTIADLFLVPQVFGAKRFKVDLSEFPIITRINDALTELPEFKVADAFRQPDTPQEVRIN